MGVPRARLRRVKPTAEHAHESAGKRPTLLSRFRRLFSSPTSSDGEDVDASSDSESSAAGGEPRPPPAAGGACPAFGAAGGLGFISLPGMEDALGLERHRPASRPPPDLHQVVADLWAAVTGGTGHCTRERYALFHICMTRALRTQFDEAGAWEKARRDFVVDCQGGASVSRARFDAMMVAIAKKWGYGPDDPAGAARFISRVCETITRGDGAPRRLVDPSAIPLGVCSELRAAPGEISQRRRPWRPASWAARPAAAGGVASLLAHVAATEARVPGPESPRFHGRRSTWPADPPPAEEAPPACPPTHRARSTSTGEGSDALRRFALLNGYRHRAGAQAGTAGTLEAAAAAALRDCGL